MRLILLMLTALGVATQIAFAQQDTAAPGKSLPPISPEEVAQEFDAADTNGNGLLEKSEWLRALPKAVIPHADVVWLRIQPSGSDTVSKQRYIEAHANGQ